MRNLLECIKNESIDTLKLLLCNLLKLIKNESTDTLKLLLIFIKGSIVSLVSLLTHFIIVLTVIGMSYVSQSFGVEHWIGSYIEIAHEVFVAIAFTVLCLKDLRKFFKNN